MGDKLQEGVKYDGGKLRMELLPYDALIEVSKVYTTEILLTGFLSISQIPFDSLIEVAKVFTFGAEKYEPNNWRKGLSWNRCFAALMRHGAAWYLGKNHDDETDLNPLTACIWYCLVLLNFRETHPELDDRIKCKVETYLHDSYEERFGCLEESQLSRDDISWSMLFNHFQAYAWKWFLGQDNVSDTDLSNLAYAAAYGLELLSLILSNRGCDDREGCEFTMNLPDKAIEFLKKFKEEQRNVKV